MYIFLSHASEEKELAESIAYSLRSRRHKVFLDRDDLPPGSSYDQRIEQAVRTSNRFIFLISPTSVTEGRYTLTELAFARRQWPDPNGRLLPVMARKTPLKDIPSYLKAVTILEPLGNATAETSVAVEQMRGRSWHLGYLGAAAAAACAVVAATVQINFGSRTSPVLPALQSSPYGIYLTGVTDPQMAVREAAKVKSIAQSIGRAGNEIRLYKRRLPGSDSSLWAIVVVYTDVGAASDDTSKYETEQNGWDANPGVINLRSWCSNAHPIPSPTGSEISFATWDCL